MLHTKTLNIIKATTGLITALLLLTAVHCSAQVSIAPTALFFNKQQQFRSLHVKNGSKQAQEISISMNFGYPATQNGHLIIAHDSALARKSSMADWMKAFPKHFTLQPQQRQVVRFIARPPQNLTPGGYWARVKIRSNPVSPPIDSMQAGKVGAQISIIINQVIGAHFRTQHAQPASRCHR
jgi:P pilus assembly chaperone PapD